MTLKELLTKLMLLNIQYREYSRIGLFIDEYVTDKIVEDSDDGLDDGSYQRRINELLDKDQQDVVQLADGLGYYSVSDGFVKIKTDIFDQHDDFFEDLREIFDYVEAIKPEEYTAELYESVSNFKEYFYNTLISSHKYFENTIDIDDARKYAIENEVFKIVNKFNIDIEKKSIGDENKKIDKIKNGLTQFLNFLNNNNCVYIKDKCDQFKIDFYNDDYAEITGEKPFWIASVRGHKYHVSSTNTFYSRDHPIIVLRNKYDSYILGGSSAKVGAKDVKWYHIPYFETVADYEKVLNDNKFDPKNDKEKIIDFFYTKNDFGQSKKLSLNNLVGEEKPQLKTPAIEQIYDQLAEVFGGTNPGQVLSMLMPGSNLNIDDFRYNTNEVKPTKVKEAESRLVNQMFDIAKVQAGSNGQKVSSQYMQALSVLVPTFNPLLPQVKNILRDYINMPAPETSIDGVPFKGTLQDYYFRVYEKWLEEKGKWQEEIEAKKREFVTKNPATAQEEYLSWFEVHGEVRLARITALFGKLLSVYSPSDMDAILGALTSGPGGEIEEAINFVNSFKVLSSSGNFVYPVDLSPSNWSQYLQSTIEPVNLLKDPEYLLQSLNNKKQALRSCMAQLANIAGKATSNADIQKAKLDYINYSKEYDNAQLELQKNYEDNTVLAIQLYLQKKKTNRLKASGNSPEEIELNKLIDEVNVSTDAANQPTITLDDTKKKYEDVATRSDLILQKAKTIELKKTLAEDSIALVEKEKAAIKSDSTIENYKKGIQNIAKIVNRFSSDVENVDQELKKIKVASREDASDKDNNAGILATDIEKIAAGIQKVDQSQQKLTQLGKNIADAARGITAMEVSVNADMTFFQAKFQSLIDEITLEEQNLMVAINNPKSKIELSTPPTPEDGASGANTKAIPNADKSDPFMTFQFSFSSSQVNNVSKQDSSASETRPNANFFFGGYSYNDSSSKASAVSESLDQNTEIKIAFKAAKVDVGRDWLNPGIFKLTDGMNRLSNNVISKGFMALNGDKKLDWGNVYEYNKAIFPSFPSSFIIAKDVVIEFKVQLSQVKSVHEIMDQKSSSGGGIFCFSANRSSSSRKDESSLQARSEGTNFRISIPSPQILAWYLQLLPQDKSTVMDMKAVNTATSGKDLNILQFVKEMRDFEHKKSDPVQNIVKF